MFSVNYCIVKIHKLLYYAFKWSCQGTKFQTLGDSRCQWQVRWCQTMPWEWCQVAQCNILSPSARSLNWMAFQAIAKYAGTVFWVESMRHYVFSQSGWQSQLMRLLQRAEAGCMRVSVWDTASTSKSGWLAGKLMSEGEWKIPKKKGKDKTIHTIPMVFHHQPGNHISYHHCNDIILSPDNSVSWILVTERACLFFDDKCKCENPKFASF